MLLNRIELCGVRNMDRDDALRLTIAVPGGRTAAQLRQLVLRSIPQFPPKVVPELDVFAVPSGALVLYAPDRLLTAQCVRAIEQVLKDALSQS